MENITMSDNLIELTLLKSSRKRRIGAFLIDHFIFTFLMVSIVFILMGPNFMDEESPVRLITTMFTVMIPVFILYFAKDSLKGVSIGKWIMGIMVRDENDSNEIPSFGRLLLRNLFIIIWPVEFIVLVVNDRKQRLGDKVARTIVIKNLNQPALLPRVLAVVGVGTAFFAFTFFFAGSAMKSSDAYKTAVIEIQKNEKILSETGGIKGFGMIPTGSINITNGYGVAQLEIKVLGNIKDIQVSVHLEKEPGGRWKLTEMIST